MKRRSGILIHPTSLPSKYCIGDLGKHAYKLIDILFEAGFTLWQILPLNPVNYTNSPYSATSTLAMNTMLICPEDLLEKGLIDEIPEMEKEKDHQADFEKAKQYKGKLLEKAFLRFDINNEEFLAFCRKNDKLRENAVFDILLSKNKCLWNQWNEKYSESLLEGLYSEYKAEIDRYLFEQYIVHSQWLKLKEYANRKGVMIIGDVPIYTDFNSYDVWANDHIFDIRNRDKTPREVAGVPPDYFSEEGQLWGNPLFKWHWGKELNGSVIKWWKTRFEKISELVDIVRIDHFRGFEKYWAVKYGKKTAKEGKWKKGPGKKFFEALHKEIKNIEVIAEDLGIITEKVEKLRSHFGFPGMKILQFAFSDPENKYLPSNYSDDNFVVYTGTHDNNTCLGWYREEVSEETKAFINKWTQKSIDAGNITENMIITALSSTAKYAVIPIQDILNLDSDHRMNKPSVTSGNWAWKMEITDLEKINVSHYKALNHIYNR